MYKSKQGRNFKVILTYMYLLSNIDDIKKEIGCHIYMVTIWNIK